MSKRVETIDMLALMLARAGKENSRALPARQYGDPANHVEFGRAMEYKEIADALLQEWHDWSAAYRPALGMPGCSPSSRQAQSSKQWQSTHEIAEESVRKAEMEVIEWCVDALKPQYRQAIGIEMRNRGSGAMVWRQRAPGVASYADALEAILPLLKRRGVFD
ncbi:hypothetical protein [Herbaspirillum autotrophicum]|uniref:hypothetical protein n=1 Tax=Herbaspirillum autotrophicum TaxID=180195 RepID=UPI00067A7E4C|nr:hypothetical protein [Herbaspirillum autotrophicum]